MSLASAVFLHTRWPRPFCSHARLNFPDEHPAAASGSVAAGAAAAGTARELSQGPAAKRPRTEPAAWEAGAGSAEVGASAAGVANGAQRPRRPILPASRSGGAGDGAAAAAPARPTQGSAEPVAARRSSAYRGVSAHRSHRWRAQVQQGGLCAYVGIFDSELDAARAHGRAAKELLGA